MKPKPASRPVLYIAEPPAGYLGRPPIVVDCSVLSAALFQEESRDAAWQIMAGKSLHAPLLLDSEIVSVAAKKNRAGVLEGVIVRALAEYGQQRISFRRPDVQAQYGLAVRYGISTYDAAYLWLAGFLQAPIATFDAKLAKVARTHLASPP